MNFQKQSLLGLFDSSQKTFVIPVYQRAYSWDKEHWQTLLEDLKEQVSGSNNTYFFGNLLLETMEEDVSYEIIDGQQRITTLSIFIRSLLTVLAAREGKGEPIGISIKEKERLFLKDGGNKKLRPVSYDKACYDALIIDGKDSFETSSPSQRKIKEAKVFFIKELEKEPTDVLIKILKKIETTKITSIELTGKKEAALMFELQNNRGKDLTNMERLKSYFMYQMYVYSKPEETETNIEHVSNIFKLIYSLINDIRLNEDSILIYHCNAYIKGYAYRTIDDIKEAFKKSTNKVGWINEFIEELHTSFSNMKKMEGSKDKYLKRLHKLKIPVFVYAFLIKGYKYFGDDEAKLSKLFHIMEILVFRYNLMNSRADIIARLNEILLGFKGDVDLLRTSLKNKLNDTWYWGDTRTKNTLDEWMYENSVLHYLLWRYEAHIQKKGYVVGTMKLDNEQIEHISPQVPPGEAIAAGYEVDASNSYTEEFKRDYLNSLGNLMLISGSHNASIGNRPFKEKLSSYKENPLLNQQGEIKNFASGTPDNPIWDTKAIDKRHEALVNFAVRKWSFDNI
jgi:hypothetical protein